MSPETDQPTVALPGGVRMPMLGFGTWQITGRRAYEAVRAALDAGYRHIDTATMYGNEAEVGRAIRDSGVPREDVFVTTKLLPADAGRERESIAASLAALDTGYVDLWLVHWPPSSGRQRVATWREFLAVRDEGLARAVGVSNYDPAGIDALIEATGEAPAVNQIRWGPSLYDARLLADHRDRGVVLEGYSPFKSTNLGDPVLATIAEAHGVTPSQVVLRWHLDHGVVAIPKSVTPERIRENIDVFGFSLTESERRQLDALGR
jgi:diketogulonate reductase-like aldo/keto reductase